MPYFFQFSKNGRRLSKLPVKARKKYSRQNQSTMNRICAAFDDIGNLNMNYANIPPFNWQMLLSSNNETYQADAILMFCKMDDKSAPSLRDSLLSDSDQELKTSMLYSVISCDIASELETHFGSLETVYPSIVKYLFAGSNAIKVAHKQMFWRVFGDLACKALEQNMKTYTVCEKCGMKIPSWSGSHTCPKDTVGFFECCDCGAWCERTNSKQYRCATCQDEFHRTQNNLINKMKYQRQKAEKAA